MSIETTTYSESTVPNVIGMGAKDAIFLMNRAGLDVSINGYGKVVSQTHTAGQMAKRGTRITLTLKP